MFGESAKRFDRILPLFIGCYIRIWVGVITAIQISAMGPRCVRTHAKRDRTREVVTLALVGDTISGGMVLVQLANALTIWKEMWWWLRSSNSVICGTSAEYLSVSITWLFRNRQKRVVPKVDRLNVLVRELFSLMLRFHCIISFYWLSSEDNILADDLSRDREADFLSRVRDSGFLAADANLIRHENAGQTRTLPENRGAIKLETSSKGSQKKLWVVAVKQHRM